MRLLLRRVAPAVLLFRCLATSVLGIDPQEFAVLVRAQVQSNPAQIILQWPLSSQTRSYTVSRKGLAEQSWHSLATLDGTATGFTDNSVISSAPYEYEVAAVSSYGITAYGYIYAGSEVFFPGARGRVVLLVDETLSSALQRELARLQDDLVGDGWTVLRHDVARTGSPGEVKALVRDDYNADPLNTKTVFLLGHVPVPYSGDLNPDLHPSHRGAWPADVYYGDMDGNWTDQSITDVSAEDPRNHNLPGDGKFDQSQIPGNILLQVGRVDFSELPGFEPRTEVDLMRQYLEKNHNFRHKVFDVERRAIIRDNFGEIDGDAPATDAWRSFAAFFTPDQVRAVDPNQFFPTLTSGSYLWAYGGGGGEFYQADSVGSSYDFAAQSPRCVFYMLHGSYFGDWDSWDNFLRAALASPGYGLVAAWTGLPHWFLHPMALGETIGQSTVLAQQNRGLYKNQVNLSPAGVHISVMGDPTLRMHVVAPVSNLTAAAPGDGSVTLNWTAPADSIRGYFVYRADSTAGPFARLTRTMLTGTAYIDSAVPAGSKTYMVRAVKLESTPSGTYYNASQGIFVTADAPLIPAPTISLLSHNLDGSVVLGLRGTVGRSYRLESSKDLDTWVLAHTAIFGDPPVDTFKDTPAPGRYCFYRVRWN